MVIVYHLSKCKKTLSNSKRSVKCVKRLLGSFLVSLPATEWNGGAFTLRATQPSTSYIDNSFTIFPRGPESATYQVTDVKTFSNESSPSNQVIFFYENPSKIIADQIPDKFETLEKGVHSYKWEGRRSDGNLLPSGIYFYNLYYSPINGSKPKIVSNKTMLLK